MRANIDLHISQHKSACRYSVPFCHSYLCEWSEFVHLRKKANRSATGPAVFDRQKTDLGDWFDWFECQCREMLPSSRQEGRIWCSVPTGMLVARKPRLSNSRPPPASAACSEQLLQQSWIRPVRGSRASTAG